ncbi:MAG: carboxylesterase family protein, partial [Bacteroidota bacterium]
MCTILFAQANFQLLSNSLKLPHLMDHEHAFSSEVTIFSDINYAIGVPQNELSLDVYVPDGGEVFKPVMIYVHGGSWRRGDKANTAFKDEFFTSQDYVFVSLNYRLAPDPPEIDNPDRIIYNDQAGDVAKAIAWVFDSITTYGGDTSKVAIIGHSAGAHLISLVTTDEIYLNAEGISLSQIKCACSLDAGAHDIPYYLNNYVTEGENQWFSYLNAFTDDNNAW